MLAPPSRRVSACLLAGSGGLIAVLVGTGFLGSSNPSPLSSESTFRVNGAVDAEVGSDGGAEVVETGRKLLSARRLETALEKKDKEKREMKKLVAMALNAADEVLQKVVVPKMNVIIPENIREKGDDPMRKVVDSKSLKVTNLAGLAYFSIESMTTSSIQGSTEFLQGLSETATAQLECQATVTQPMTATGTFEIGKGSKHRRLGFVKDTKDAADMTAHAVEGASGTYQMQFNKVKITVPMTGTLQISAGTNLLNAQDVMSNLKHITIQEITNQKPHVSVDIKLDCPITDMDCHTANGMLLTFKPEIDDIIGDHAKTILQNILDKALPKTLGEKTQEKASGTVSGRMGLSTDISNFHVRHLQAAALIGSVDSSSAPDLDAADANVSIAIKRTLAELASMPTDGVEVNMSRNGSDVTAAYLIPVTPYMDRDAYSMTYSLLTPEAEELETRLLQKLNAGFPYDFNVTSHTARVLSPQVQGLGIAARKHKLGRWVWIVVGCGVVMAGSVGVVLIGLLSSERGYASMDNGKRKKKKDRSRDFANAEALVPAREVRPSAASAAPPAAAPVPTQAAISSQGAPMVFVPASGGSPTGFAGSPMAGGFAPMPQVVYQQVPVGIAVAPAPQSGYRYVA